MSSVNVIQLKWAKGVTSPQSFVLLSGYVMLQCYIFYVVHSFMKEMELELSMSSAMRPLTEAEVAEFEDGLKPSFSFENLEEDVDIGLLEKVKFKRYNKEEFEIDMDKLVVGTVIRTFTIIQRGVLN